jgi:hypothetical protein
MTSTPDDPARACACRDAPGCEHTTVPEQRLAEAIWPAADTAPADPDRPCYHPDVDVRVRFGRIGEGDDDNPTPGMPMAFMIEVDLDCRACREAFVFDGVPAGMSFDSPAVSVDGRELRAPVRPVSLPPRHRRGITGVSGYRIEAITDDDEPAR